MIKNKFPLLTIICLLTFVLCLTVACHPEKSGDPPAAPEGLSVSADGKVNWKRVKNADSYELEVNGVLYSVKFTSFNLSDVENKPSDGNFVVRIRAIGKQSEGAKRSQWSQQISYRLSGEKLLAPIVYEITDGVVKWYPSTDADAVSVTVNTKESRLNKDTVTFDMSETMVDEVFVELYFVGDGVYRKDSDKTTFIYNSLTKKARLPSPKNVRMDGQTLIFDGVNGADIYYVTDCNNTVVSVTETYVDRSEGYLPKYVSCFSSSGIFGESEKTDVTYFSDGKGDGTAQNPYLISDYNEFRYIEFYESMLQKSHFRLANDISFPEITLGDNEDGTNTYKIGSFSGVLDGDGYSVKNLVSHTTDGYSALFSSINDGAEIKNIVFDGAKWRTWTVKTADGILHEKGGDVAILAYTNRGTIRNVTVVNSSVSAAKDGAATLTVINRGEIISCTIGAGTTITGQAEVGGIAVYNEATILNCSNYAEVDGGKNVGGIVGRNAGNVRNCTNYGKISGIKRVGGIVGYNYNVLFAGETERTPRVYYCVNRGEVSSSGFVGGIAGQNGSDGTAEVGVVSPVGADIRHCYNVGAVKGKSVKGGAVAGGIVGSNYAAKTTFSGVVGCFNVGKVTSVEEIHVPNRIYLDVSACVWAKNDGAALFAYCWTDGEETGPVPWPGEALEETEIDGQKLYYADIPQSFNRVVFSRGNPSGNEVYNQTSDLVFDSSRGLYILASDFTSTGHWVNTNSLAGGIAGFNAAVDDCFYLNTSCTTASHANGTLQTNLVRVDGTNNPTQAAVSQETLTSAEFVARLNATATTPVWKTGSDHPVFTWED